MEKKAAAACIHNFGARMRVVAKNEKDRMKNSHRWREGAGPDKNGIFSLELQPLMT